MTKSLHPLKTTDRIRDSYLRYLKTIYPFQDPDMRQEFKHALEKPDMVVRGPLLESSPPFETGRSIEQLIQDGVLHPDFHQLCSNALPLQRPLYLHQDQAITKTAQAGRNLIVATGTGSGKTETFLIPILNYLLQQRTQGKLSAGVRALLLYPMNALANDQLKRLRQILAEFPDITFGRYTGETKPKLTDAEDSFKDQFPLEPRIPNELISREQMRKKPPHIVLTNYAMLEYLLLRPEDNIFFDGDAAQFWRFIALDEAHVYSGANGIEIAMLLRRLKDRVVKSKQGRLTCLATSATIGEQADFSDAVIFAKNLFSEPFEWEQDDPARQDVVQASRLPLSVLSNAWGEGTPGLYQDLVDLVQTEEKTLSDLLKVVENHQLPSNVVKPIRQVPREQENTINAGLYRLLRGDERLHRLHEALAGEPQFLTELSPLIFPNEADADQQLINLVELAARARPDSDSLSLLPARYHLFARALEGAFACLDPVKHTHSEPRLYLSRQESCPHCSQKVFELATCTRCGTAYIVGEFKRDELGGLTHLKQNSAAIGKTSYFVLDSRMVGLDEDEAVATQDDLAALADDSIEPYTLCRQCGVIERGAGNGTRCSCNTDRQVTIYKVDPRTKTEKKQGIPPEATQLRRCVSCGSRSNNGIVFRFLTGKDAPVSVLATAFYQSLPPASDEETAAYPGEGRKLLAFADSRQDAAFFAPYMEQTYHKILRRRLIVKTLLADPDGRAGRLRLQDLTHRLLKQAETAGIFSSAQSYDKRQIKMRTWLMQELIALDRRNSLEGLGLLHFCLVRPDQWQPPAPLLSEPWNLSPDQAWDLIALLLDTLRQQGATQFLDGVDPRVEAFEPRNRALYIRKEKAEPKYGIFGWIPSQGSNRRLDILEKLLSKTSALSAIERKKVAREALKSLWDCDLSLPNSAWCDHLPSENIKQSGSTVHRLSPLFWEVKPVELLKLPIYRCRHCHTISYINLHNTCPAYRCDGELEAVASDGIFLDNHYRNLYQHLEPIPFSAQEHTAQWRSEEATKIQDKFVRGELNALSCSTTFELGVDVGQLQAVLMRNVPPTTANYVQRAGRAGRRTDSAAFALTFAQRRSHDLTHYKKPKRIVAGKIKPPVLVVTNEKVVRRHVHSVLFAAFFRYAKQKHRREFRDVGAFFTASESIKTGPELLREFAEDQPQSVADALERIIPIDLQPEFELTEWGWLRHLWQDDDDETNIQPILDAAQAEVDEDVKTLEEMEQEAIKEKRYKLAHHFQQVGKTIRDRYLFGFLGSRNILPKYGFPTDVVELKTIYSHIPEAKQVELQRNLQIAISEFAPGAEIVAAKRIWQSGGIYKRPGRELTKYNYAICPDCNRFYRDMKQLPNTCEVEVCGGNLGRSHTYLVPEFGFIVSSEEAKKSGELRPRRMYASEVYFADYVLRTQKGEIRQEPQWKKEDRLFSSTAQVWYRYSRYGLLALVNAGPGKMGFRVCDWCGAAEPAVQFMTGKRPGKPKPHKNPRTDKDCSGPIRTFHLGHDFITDVLEIQFRGSLANNPDSDLWLSVLYALLEGASDALGIRRDDLSGARYWEKGAPIPSLVLLDSVPGGAGHVRRIAENLVSTFQEAYQRVSVCECGLETSCYECLRNYHNQYQHDQLQRGLASDFLGQVLQSAGLL